MSSALEQLQADVLDYLLADEYFDDIPVYALREERIQGRIDAALGGIETKSNKTGACVSVLMPLADVEKEGAPGPVLHVSVVIRVQEHPEFNFSGVGTLKSAEEIALRVAQVLQFYQPIGFTGALFPARDFLTPSRDFLPRLTYDLKYRAMLPLTKLTRVATPTHEQQGLMITLSCATAGAAIWWTSDDSYPRPSLGGVPANGTLYTEPFDMSLVGAQDKPFRWSAHKDGLLSSYANRVEVLSP